MSRVVNVQGLRTPASLVREWLAACKGSRRSFLQSLSLGPRLLRLFAVACCDDIIARMRDERSVLAVRVAELYADGLATEEERRAAATAATAAYAATATATAATTAAAAAAAATATAATAAYTAAATAAATAADRTARKEKWLIQGHALVAMVGPGWVFDPAWRTSTAVALTRRIYDAKEWDTCPVLADALQDAGCSEADVLDYLRGSGQKFRGCRILDELLGKRSESPTGGDGER